MFEAEGITHTVGGGYGPFEAYQVRETAATCHDTVFPAGQLQSWAYENDDFFALQVGTKCRSVGNAVNLGSTDKNDETNAFRRQ